MSSFFFHRFLLMAGIMPRFAQRPPSATEYPLQRASSQLACQVEQVFPELVRTDSNGYRAVTCDTLLPVLLEERKKLVDENSDLRRMLLAQQEKAQAAMESFERHLRGRSSNRPPFA